MTPPPHGAINDTRTRILLEVIRQDHPTVTTIADAVGCARSTAFANLRKLRREGLVDWVPAARMYTLHACVVPTPIGR